MAPVRRELAALFRLSWPLVLSQVGMMLFGLVDIWMVGRLGARELAAVALADIVMFGSLITGIGLVMGIDPVVTQAHGAGAGVAAGRALQRGIVIACAVAVPVTLVWLYAGDILVLLHEPADLAHLAQVYADAQVWSIAPFLVFTALRQYLQGREIVFPPLWIILGANVANAILNYGLVFGRFGLPEWGVRGAGVATGATRTLMMVALFAYIFLRGLHRGAWTPWSRAVFKWDRFKQLLGYGWPVALHLGLEVGAFGASGLMAGWLGATATAAHVVVLRLASFAFMLPLGISMAAATRVGNLLGARDRPGAQRAAWVALSVGAGAMCVSAACFLLFPEVLVRFFNDEAAVVANALLIFPIAAAFQVFDGTQVVGGSILRGMGTPRPAALINLLGYYGLAIPLGYWLAFKAGLDLAGVWWGLALGLMAVALAMVGWIAVRGPARVKELAIAEPEA